MRPYGRSGVHGSPTLLEALLGVLFCFIFLLMYYFYVLYSIKDHKLYKGFSGDIPSKLWKHFNGGVNATRENTLGSFHIHTDFSYIKHCM